MRSVTMMVAALTLAAGVVVAPARGQGAARSPAIAPYPMARVASAAGPRAPWLDQDPADSLYRLARTELNAGQYRMAAGHFHLIWSRYPRSGYASDAMYWEAFARSKTGNTDDAREALAVLKIRTERFPDAANSRDARDLATRLQSQLARQGDAAAAADIAVTAGSLVPAAAPPASHVPSGAAVAAAPPAVAPPAPPMGGISGVVASVAGDRCNDDSDDRLMALNALLQMNSDQAMPILKQVLARRDSGSTCLRRKALFVVAQQHTPDAEDILLSAARSDPDAEIRGNAIFWLSQVHSPRAITALDSVLRGSADTELQKKAIFALAQQDDDRATAALKAYIERADAPDDLRGDAIFWLGQRGDGLDIKYLEELFGRTSNDQLKEKILFTIAQQNNAGAGQWLLGVASSPKESTDIRKKALFWAAQGGNVSTAQLVGLYDKASGREMKEQIIFALSQQNDSAAVDEMIHIAKTEPDHELRRKVLFWLGQSHDPRVAKVLMEIINQ